MGGKSNISFYYFWPLIVLPFETTYTRCVPEKEAKISKKNIEKKATRKKVEAKNICSPFSDVLVGKNRKKNKKTKQKILSKVYFAIRFRLGDTFLKLHFLWTTNENFSPCVWLCVHVLKAVINDPLRVQYRYLPYILCAELFQK
jgi:hypothetical protein